MAKRRVATIGGGPAGLFAARLLARRHSDWTVEVFERLPAEDTFGFGVGLTGAALARIDAADPEVHEAIVGASRENATAEFRLPTGRALMSEFHRGGSIGRARLLRVLQDQAERAGVLIHVGESADPETLARSHDLVIAADGVSSPTRQTYHREFAPQLVVGRTPYLWCGADVDLPGTIFMPVPTEHGVFMTHAYPFAEGRSTLVMEASEGTLRRAGLDVWEPSSATSEESDERSLTLLSEVFAELLDGKPLLGNRSRWAKFRTVTCKSWRHENVVLIGDAAATAHYSLGSGTKLALEAAAGLADALDDESVPLSVNLERYEATWRPAVDRLQARGQRSQLWWDSLPTRLDLSPARMCVSYYTRAGAVSVDDEQPRDAGFVRQAIAEWAAVTPGEVPRTAVTQWVIERSALVAPHEFTSLQVEVDLADPWGEQADRVVAQMRAALDAGDKMIALTGASSRDALLDRLAFAERLRSELSARVLVTVSAAFASDIADALVAGRIDLFRFDAKPAGVCPALLEDVTL